MSRQEAATVYIDVLLGFRNGYRRYSEASEVLSARDKELLQAAVHCPAGRIEGQTEGLFFDV